MFSISFEVRFYPKPQFMVPAIIGDNVVLFMVLFFNEIGNSSIQVYFLKFLKYKKIVS
jgi:hypothetical protein